IINPYNSHLVAWINNGNAFFSEGQILESSRFHLYTKLGDLDSDGDLDMINIGTFQSDPVIWENQDGIFGEAIPVVSGINATSDVGILDINSDGFNDVILSRNPTSPESNPSSGVFLNGLAGVASFSELGPGSIRPVSFLGSFRVNYGDFNNDGIVDFLSDVNSLGEYPRVFSGEGITSLGGGFNASDLNIIREDGLGVSRIQGKPCIADFNNDGYDDFVGNVSSDGVFSGVRVFVYSPNGEGCIGSNTCLASTGQDFGIDGGNGGNDVVEFMCEDMNGDGLVDFIVDEPRGPGVPESLYVFLNQGDGTFDTTSSVVLTRAEFGGVADVAVGDLDGDGDNDFFLAGGASTPHRVLLNNNPPIAVNDTGYEISEDNLLVVSATEGVLVND
ncbi:MAG: FG-GAP-like repeat-containing protein, partial [Bacteroidota bacterium]